MFNDGETVVDYVLRLSNMAVYLATLGEEVKDGEIIVKMLWSLPSRFKQIMITIKIGRLKVAFEKAPTSL
jgi:hypothetical protein